MIRSVLGPRKKPGEDDSHQGFRAPASESDGESRSHDDESNWLVSYADMMTLLCGFFIMLFSMTKMDEPQFERIKQTLAEQFGGEYHSPNADLAKWVTQILQDTPLKGEADVETSAAGVAIVFRSAVFFDTLSAELTERGSTILEQLVGSLQERQKFEKKAFRFVVEGHTDSRPLLSGPFATNWELSAARAARVVRVFVDKGFSPQSMAALGYSDTRPAETSKLPDGRWDEPALAKNRRVVIRVFHDAEAQALAELAEQIRSREPAGSPGNSERRSE
jgi:chemotaxis protein MotB